MASEQQWQGASGKSYTYFVYPLDPSFNDGDGNYIYTKKNTEGNWVPIYIGEGNLAERSQLSQHHQGACIRSKGATHFHCHLNADQQARLAEEDDLLKRFTDAYKPKGCNEKKGG